jgi:hypothetical protein
MSKNNKSPRPYGRQGKDKTIKSLSLDSDVAKWVTEEAKRRGVKDSSLVNELLKKLMLLILLAALASYLLTGDPLPGAWLVVQAIGTAAYYAGMVALEVVAAIV